MDLFHKNGHITRQGLRALCGETLDEMARLELSEHLAFCDVCMEAYLEMLENGPMLEPKAPLRPFVENKVRLSRWKMVLGKVATVAAAFLLVTGLWAAGVFDGLTDSGNSLAQMQSQRSQQAYQQRQQERQRLQEEKAQDEFPENTGDVMEKQERVMDRAVSGMQSLLKPQPGQQPMSAEEELQMMLEEAFPEREGGRRPTKPAFLPE